MEGGGRGCSIAQLVTCWPAARQARVRIPARHSREVFPAEKKQYRENLYYKGTVSVLSVLAGTVNTPLTLKFVNS